MTDPRKPDSRKYPPLPKTVDGPGGMVTVVLKKNPKHEDGTACWGLWEEHIRTITVDEGATPRHQWKVYYHELCHVAITDAGLDDILEDRVHEAICNAYACQRMRERFGG